MLEALQGDLLIILLGSSLFLTEKWVSIRGWFLANESFHFFLPLDAKKMKSRIEKIEIGK